MLTKQPSTTGLCQTPAHQMHIHLHDWLYLLSVLQIMSPQSADSIRPQPAGAAARKCQPPVLATKHGSPSFAAPVCSVAIPSRVKGAKQQPTLVAQLSRLENSCIRNM